MNDKRHTVEVTFTEHGNGEHVVVFVHGFLDAARIWDETIAQLNPSNLKLIAIDLPGMGESAGSNESVSLERFTEHVLAFVDSLDKPFVIVGQSMGTQVAELVAVSRPDAVRGLVLLSPIPLGGVHLKPDELKAFADLGGNPDAQEAARYQLASELSSARLRELIELGLPVSAKVVRESAQAWNRGDARGEVASVFKGPVLIARGERDGFVTQQMMDDGVVSRFAGASVKTFTGVGHWPHFENPIAVACLLDEFLASVDWAGSGGITADGVHSQGWTRAFEQKSQEGFASALDANVTLQASVLRIPVQGRENVQAVMAVASKIYESLVFTHEAVNGARSYLEWSATAFGGMQLLGITVLEKADDGRILNIAIHHRPLTAALRFSCELRDRLDGVIDASHFHGEVVAA